MRERERERERERVEYTTIFRGLSPLLRDLGGSNVISIFNPSSFSF